MKQCYLFISGGKRRAFLACLATSLSIFLLLPGLALAQIKTISGTVTDAKDGSPLVGVVVKVQNSKAATSTNAEGKFSLQVR